jgi:phytoene synthase
MTTDAVLRESRKTIAKGSKSFFTASLLLPAPIRNSAHLLYTWCRYCDDCVDGQKLGFADESHERPPADVLEYLTEQTRLALAGEPVEEVPFRALSRVVAEYDMPEIYPFAHLDGFAMDVRGDDFDTLDDTIRYCYHVAGVVGVMMARIMGVRDRDALDRAADLGIAFQLTNIARDVIGDADAGRVYVPRQWIRESGIDPDRITHSEYRAPLAVAIGKLLDEAERYYTSALVGIAQLPFRSAWSIAAARLIYRDIGHVVRRLGQNAWDERVSISLAGKLRWVVIAVAHTTGRQVVGNRMAEERAGLWPIPQEDA